MEKIYDAHGTEHPVAQLIKAVHSRGGDDLLKEITSTGVEPTLHGNGGAYRASHVYQPAVDTEDLSTLSDDALDDVIKQGREHLPPCPDAADYATLDLTRRACLERSKRLLRARAGKPYVASTPGDVTE